MPSFSPEISKKSSAVSRPSRLYTAETSLPSPGAKKASSPSLMKRSEMSGLPSAQRSAAERQAEVSVRSDFKNLSRAGVLKKRSRTLIVVPSGQPQGSIISMSPASTLMRTPSLAPRLRVVSSMCETAEIAASASPRKPKVPMASSPRSFCSLLVAWRRKQTPASSGSMPLPSSVTRMSDVPPPRISTVTFFAPASKAFSHSSLMTEAGRSTTSPAAMRSATWGERMLISGMFGGPFSGFLIFAL